MNITELMGVGILKDSNTCEFYGEKFFNIILGEIRQTLLYSSFFMILFILSYLALEYYKMIIRNKLSEFESIHAYVEIESKICFYQKCLLMGIFLIGARLLQYAFWSYG